MKTMGQWLACGMVLALLGASVFADEEKVPLDKLPKAVVKAVKDKFPKAKLVSAEKEKEDGKTVYEVNIKNEGSTIEVTVTPEGKIVSIEKTIALKDLPKAVAEAYEKKYPKATAKKVEEIIKDGKTSYELLIVTKDKQTLEVVFDAKGKFLKEEKKKKGEKE